MHSQRRGNSGKLEEFLDQTSIYEAIFIFMSYSRLLSFSNFQTQYTLYTFHVEKCPHSSLFGYLGQLINKSCLCWRSMGRSPEKNCFPFGFCLRGGFSNLLATLHKCIFGQKKESILLQDSNNLNFKLFLGCIYITDFQILNFDLGKKLYKLSKLGEGGR